MALSLMTSLPVTKYLPSHWSEKDQSLSVMYYPLVGLLLACIIYGIYALLPNSVAPLVGATIVVVLSVLLTGAIHLDGLADAADAAYAAHSLPKSDVNKQRKEKILSIFKDPRAGPMAVVVLIVVVLSKVILLSQLMDSLLLSLVTMLILSRLLASCYIATTPYARASGLALDLVKCIPKMTVLLMLLAVSFFFFVLLPFGWFLLLFTTLFLWLLFWRSFWLKRIDGFVGDCVGALIETSEVFILLLIYLLQLS